MNPRDLESVLVPLRRLQSAVRARRPDVQPAELQQLVRSVVTHATTRPPLPPVAVAASVDRWRARGGVDRWVLGPSGERAP